MEEEIKLYRLDDEHIWYFNRGCSCGLPDDGGNEPGVRVLASEIFNVNPEDAYVAEVMGDSMVEADIRKGDKLIIDTQREAVDGDVVLAMIDNGFTLKFLQHDANGDTWLVPANSRLTPRRVFFDGVQTRIVGVMTSMVRETPRFDASLKCRLDVAIREQYNYLKVEETEDKPFYALIPNTKDKAKVLRQLHNALDGKNGIELIRYLRAAIELDYLTHMPTLGELTGEFSVDITRSYYYRNKDKEFPDSMLEDYRDQLC